jgi:hypothetical protein
MNMEPPKLLVTCFALLVSACATLQPTTPPAELKARADDAMRLNHMCARSAVPDVDDGISDAQTIALALALRCSHEYQQSIEAFGAANLDNDAERRMFRERLNSPQGKIESFLPVVMNYRASLRKVKP